MTKRGVVCSLLAAFVAVGPLGFVEHSASAGTPAGQIVFDSINTPGASVHSRYYDYWAKARSGGPAPLFPWGSGFYAKADGEITGITVMASSACTSNCADVQFQFVEENASGTGVIASAQDPSSPGYVRVADSALPRSPVPDPQGVYLAPVTLVFPVPLDIKAGHGYFLNVQDVGLDGSGTHASLGDVAGAQPSDEYAAWPSFVPGGAWQFPQCVTGSGCLAIQAFDGAAPSLPQPVAVAVSGSQSYGSSPTFTTPASPPAGDAFIGTLRCSQEATGHGAAITSGLPAGEYQIDSPSCSGLALTGPTAANYAIVYVGQSLTVARAMLTVAAADATRPFGFGNPPLSYSFGGFVNGEGPSVISGQPTLSTPADSTSPPGTYSIDVNTSAMSADNYYLVPVSGWLTISRATPVITLATMHISAAVSARRVQFTAIIHNTTAAGPPASGVPVTFTVRTSVGRKVMCSATTNGAGFASCTSRDVLDFTFANPRSYTATVVNTLPNYTGATANAAIRY